MRTILSLLAIFSLAAAAAQQRPEPSFGLDAPRGALRVYPTASAAATADPDAGNRYLTRLSDWQRNGDTFTAQFTVPFAWINRQVFFLLDSASADYDVRVNGTEAAHNADPNAPATVNITKLVSEGRNRIEVTLRRPSPSAPLESWRENPEPAIAGACIMSQPTLHLRDVIVRTRLAEDGDATAEVGLVVKSEALNPRTSRLYYDLLSPAGTVAASGYKEINLDMRREDTLRFVARIPMDSLWSAARPQLYTLKISTQHAGRNEEYVQLPVGFRVVGVERQQLSVNGEAVTLRMREIPADASPEQLAAWRDQGYNTFALLPGAVNEPLLDSCDRWGLYVIAQAPIDTRRSGVSRRVGGNPSNDPRWKEAYVERTANSYHTAKRHPSVIGFSLAVQSANGINLYESYLNLKRFGDTRPLIYRDGGGEWNNDPLRLE